jgi:D-alanyl-D-alanine carboxypeptidase (penicillin-binding protein 5/6)
MKKTLALILTALLTLSLAACGDNANTANSGAVTPPSTAEPTAGPLQGDVGSPRTEGDAHTFGQIPEVKTNRPREDEIPAHTEDIERISVDIAATNVYVCNVDTRSVLYQKNSDARIAPASTAKMLTALTVLDWCALDDTFAVGAEIDLIAADSSKAWLNHGDVLTVRQLLVALLLPSGNDAAYTLAVNAGEKIAGEDSVGAREAINVFVEAMNRKAEEVGAVSSNFENPDGYDVEGQYTTAFDLAQIAKACLDNDTLSEIMSSYQIYDTWENGREVTYHSTNELINPNSRYYYSKAVGLKTGSTGEAGSCLVSAAIVDGQTYICVVMGSSAGVRFSDSLAVFHAIDPTAAQQMRPSRAPEAGIPGAPE